MNPSSLRRLLLLLPVLVFLCACQTQLSELTYDHLVETFLSSEDYGLDPDHLPPAMAADGVHPQLIAHAGGSIYGYRLTNSLEALNASYKEGFRFLEVDLNETSDGQLALIHDWDTVAKRLLGREGVRSSKELHQSPVMEDLTLLTLSDLLDWLDDHPDCSIITDCKETSNGLFLHRVAQEAGKQMQQFIPQAYSFEEYDQLKGMGYDRVILTLYRMAPSPSELLQFVSEKTPWAITMSEARLTEDVVTALSEEGVCVYAHPVNSVDTVDQWYALGLTGIYTDYFLPSHWIY